jgi:hypothetical protein
MSLELANGHTEHFRKFLGRHGISTVVLHVINHPGKLSNGTGTTAESLDLPPDSRQPNDMTSTVTDRNLVTDY